MNGLNRFVVGCDCNRPTLDSIQEAGFTVTHVEHTTMPKVPKFASPAIVGSATVPPRCRPQMPGPAAGTGHDHHARKVAAAASGTTGC